MILALDTETTGTDFFHGCKPFLITGCDGSSNYKWLGQVNPYTRDVYWDEDVLTEVQLMMNKAEKIIYHGTQFDMRALETIDLKIDHLWDKIEDTLVASHCICSGDSHNLKDLAVKYFHMWDDDEEELDKAVKLARGPAGAQGYAIAKRGHPHFPGLKGGVKWYKMDMWLCMDLCVKYGLRDAERTFLLWHAFKPALIENSLWEVYKRRRRLLKVCYDITSEGMDVKLDEAKNYIEKSKDEMEAIRWRIKEDQGIKYKFSPRKSDHLADLLHNRLNIPILFRTETHRPCVDQNAIKHYLKHNQHPVLGWLADYRKLNTMVTYTESYINWADDRGLIHSNLNLTGTRETRQSSSAPNQQNITYELERFFSPRPGWVWLNIDYSNIEARIWTYAVGNKTLIDQFESGMSLHMMVMHALFPEEARRFEVDPDNIELKRIYRNVKAFNFGLLYGSSEKTADEAVGVKGAFRRLIGMFPEIGEYTAKLTREVYSNADKWNSPFITTAGGYHLEVPLDEPYKSCNYYVQGTAGEITGEAMWQISRNQDYIDSDSRMFAQVHDSLKFKIPVCNALPQLINSFCNTLVKAGEQFIPVCRVDYEVKCHPDDTHPILDQYRHAA